MPRTTPLYAVVNHTAVNTWVGVNSVLQSMWKKAVEPLAGIYRTRTHKTQKNNENSVKKPYFRSKYQKYLFKIRNKLFDLDFEAMKLLSEGNQTEMPLQCSNE
jgi:hypothetical protein